MNVYYLRESSCYVNERGRRDGGLNLEVQYLFPHNSLVT